MSWIAQVDGLMPTPPLVFDLIVAVIFVAIGVWLVRLDRRAWPISLLLWVVALAALGSFASELLLGS